MRQGLQCSDWGKPVSGREQPKLSEPMWTLFFELHAGPWRVCRRLQLLRDWGHGNEEDVEELFTRGSGSSGLDGA